METVKKLFGQDPDSQLKAAETAVATKKQELADAERALAEAQKAVVPPSGTISDGVPGGRRRKTRSKRRRTGRRSTRS